MSKPDDDKGIVFCNRVRLGNWYEATKLEEYKLNKFLEQMKSGNLMLARFRKMTDNLNAATVLTQSSGSIAFGDRISLLAPHVPELVDGCSVVALPELQPARRNTFVVTSADYCDRKGEALKYNQEFLLTLSSSLSRKPLYVRYDPNPIPGLCGLFPLFLSENPVSNTRWRVLPLRAPPDSLTRFELEDKPISVNTDVIINHCATNTNLGVNVGVWVMGFYGKICAPLMKTCLDVYGKETANNVWQIYTPIQTSNDQTEQVKT